MTTPNQTLETLHLGKDTALPANPQQAVLDRVPNPHPGTPYLTRFTCPEFTSICPVTGQPDFGILVIDYLPGQWLVESKSLKLYLGAFRNHGAFCYSPTGCALAAIGIRAAASRLIFFGRLATHPRASGFRIRVSRLIGGGDIIRSTSP